MVVAYAVSSLQTTLVLVTICYLTILCIAPSLQNSLPKQSALVLWPPWQPMHLSIQSLWEPSMPLPIAAVIPSETASFMLGNGLFSTDEVGPLFLTHLIWPAMVMAPDGTSVSTNCLIDTGAHLTCIRTDVACKLCKLASKETCKAPFSYPCISELYGEMTSRPISICQILSLFLKVFLAFSPALIVDDLCTDFILGLPFLSHNKSVVDCDTCAVIHKPTRLNLLDPSTSLDTLLYSIKRKWVPIYGARQSFSHSFKQVLSELFVLSTKSHRDLCDTSLPSPPFLFIATIKGKIETLKFLNSMKWKHAPFLQTSLLLFLMLITYL